MAEINLMDQYPRTKRSLANRQEVTAVDRQLSCQFGKDYFDGDRKHGYGGYQYHPRFWQATVRRFREHYCLPDNARILDIGCAKGFMLYDFQQLMPQAQLAGIDISTYALENALPEVRPYLKLGNVTSLPFPKNAFDLVIAINTIHNLELDDCKQALREIQRVSLGKAFIMVDAWRTATEERMLREWVLTAKTYMHVDDWIAIFKETGYTGDYFWFTVE